MNIIAHRGFWNSPQEQNTLAAFKRAIDNGFGIETDIRDHKGELVISHDPPDDKAVLAKDAFCMFQKIPEGQNLALNIKSDGLQDRVREYTTKSMISRYFVFDATIPDLNLYKKQGISFFTRQSEYEQEPAFIDDAAGVWLDAFESDWYTAALIADHLASDKEVCLVSPEIHGRPHQNVWQMVKNEKSIATSGRISLCTDYPQEANAFFEGS